MPLRNAAVILLLCAAPLRAEPVRPSQTALVADDRLRAWLATDPKVREKISRTQNAESSRRGLLARLPAPQQSGCQDFTTCSAPPVAMDLPAGESVETAIRAMLRPWIWLAEARGVRLGVAPDGSEGQTLLAMDIRSLGLSSVELNIAPRPEGGVRLWFSRGLTLAALYAHEHAALQTARP